MSVQRVCWIAVVPVTLMAMHFIVRQQAVASEPAESRKPNVVIILITITEMTLVTTSTDVSQLASVCTVTERGIKKGPSRIRTGDGGFAIRCLSRLAKGPSLPIVPILSAWQRPNLTRKMPFPTSPCRLAN